MNTESTRYSGLPTSNAEKIAASSNAEPKYGAIRF